LLEAPLSVLCVPEIARQLHSPGDLLQQTLLRSYRTDEWPDWFQAAGLATQAAPPQSIVFDSSLAMMEAALQGSGVALAPPLMFARQLAAEAICQPFAIEITTGSYWLTRLQSRPETAAMTAFKTWLLQLSG
jgi:LysR family transcriptional regulator of beta-lactamase